MWARCAPASLSLVCDLRVSTTCSSVEALRVLASAMHPRAIACAYTTRDVSISKCCETLAIQVMLHGLSNAIATMLLLEHGWGYAKRTLQVPYIVDHC